MSNQTVWDIVNRKLTNLQAACDRHLGVGHSISEYVKEYHGAALLAINNGSFGNRYAHWSKYNLRYGMYSVDGLIGECLAAMWYMRQGLWVWMDESHSSQVQGIDLWIQHPTWAYSYAVSVKCRNLHAFEVYQSDIPVDTTVNRICFVDIDHNLIEQFSMEAYKQASNNGTSQPGLTQLRKTKFAKSGDFSWF